MCRCVLSSCVLPRIPSTSFQNHQLLVYLPIYFIVSRIISVYQLTMNSRGKVPKREKRWLQLSESILTILLRQQITTIVAVIFFSLCLFGEIGGHFTTEVAGSEGFL